LEEAEQNRITYEHSIDASMDYIMDPKKQAGYYSKTLDTYAKPDCTRRAGIIFTIGVGVVSPLYGWWIMETMNAMNKEFALPDGDVMGGVLPWCGLMLAGATFIFVTKTFSQVFLNYVAENVTSGVRKDLYQAMIRKHIGWHDDRENSSGVLTATLSSDV